MPPPWVRQSLQERFDADQSHEEKTPRVLLPKLTCVLQQERQPS